jgi:hypothetical protein
LPPRLPKLNPRDCANVISATGVVVEYGLGIAAGKYAGLVGAYAGLEGEYAGLVGE